MSEINWKEVAEANGLTPEEFREQIYTTCLAIGSLIIEEQNADQMKYMAGDYELIIQRRVNQP